MNLKTKICLVLVCVIVCFIITGCKSTQIKFVTESKFQNVMNNITNINPKQKIYKSKGVVIYKTHDNNTEKNAPSIDFGPKDPTFNPPLKF